MKAYFEGQVHLLLEVLGTIVNGPLFALKGGTAINFFHTDLPRLSVDIDLAYTQINSREDFLKDNQAFCGNVFLNLQKKHDVLVQIQRTKEGIPKQINISSKDTGIKVDINIVLRGTVYPIILKESCKAINKKYETVLTLNTLSFEDVYAGKFCAALDRQHPRDLFDVLIFFRNHQITDKLKKAFLVYLMSGSRPISEFINPNRLDQRVFFENEFLGMTDYQVSYGELEEAREVLIQKLDDALNQQDREFLVSFKKGEANWAHLDMDHIKDMPAVKWKQHNLMKMSPQKHEETLNELKRKLGI
ncbi:MAG: nucleotidyl transferase AbiEii/AbiGii toxin family protein [Alphaproteobacteria bacterium]|nr:nucleotidyl transferase AbiEii/AbiGii toxin family protein [Alphaproteobacteria bacterium]